MSRYRKTDNWDRQLQSTPRISALYTESDRVWLATISYDFDGRFGDGYDPVDFNFKSLKVNNISELAAHIHLHQKIIQPVAMASATISPKHDDITRLIQFGRHFDPVVEFWSSERLEEFWDMNVGQAIDAISSLLDLDKRRFGELLGPWFAYATALAVAFDPKTEEVLSRQRAYEFQTAPSSLELTPDSPQLAGA